MKVAVWRYGMALQTSDKSTVGGGLLTAAVVRALVAAGHTVHVVGPVAKGCDVRTLGAAHVPGARTLAGYDAAVILTGPYNPLYGDAAFDTYRRLAGFSGVVAYAQWDVALPFHFGAMLSPKAAALAKVHPDDVLRDKHWYVLAQTSEADLRAKTGKSVGYATAPWTHVPCFFELEELQRPALAPVEAPLPALGYFGSDRPERVPEVLRWFAAPGAPPVQLYGRWSPKSLQAISAVQGFDVSFEYRGTVAEAAVARTLNGYAATMYLADTQYVKTDFIAQRFFENVTAGVPVLYSDKLQPSVRAAIPSDLICHDVAELTAKYAVLRSLAPAARREHVRLHAEAVRAFARRRTDTLTHALAQVLR